MGGVSVRDVEVCLGLVVSVVELSSPYSGCGLFRGLSERLLMRKLQAQKFIDAYAAFLKRQGKLPIPGSFHSNVHSQHRSDLIQSAIVGWLHVDMAFRLG
jgi:hypothetical protein